MKKYIGTKQVEAEPMTMGDAYKRGLLRTGVIPDEEYASHLGYHVKYEDGYESWSPKETFEKSYRVTETLLDRLHIEHEDLSARMNKLIPLIASGEIVGVDTDPSQNLLLRLQHSIMGHYLNVLRCRIGRVNGPSKTPLRLMAFGEAVEVLKQGGAVRRRDWGSKNIFVVKQVPSHIAEGVIPKMQSLPQSAKDIVMGRKEKTLHYYNQMIIIYPNGRVDSWIPSSSDIFATDWEIAEAEKGGEK